VSFARGITIERVIHAFARSAEAGGWVSVA
jgi:hypothetical protein